MQDVVVEIVQLKNDTRNAFVEAALRTRAMPRLTLGERSMTDITVKARRRVDAAVVTFALAGVHVGERMSLRTFEDERIVFELRRRLQLHVDHLRVQRRVECRDEIVVFARDLLVRLQRLLVDVRGTEKGHLVTMGACEMIDQLLRIVLVRIVLGRRGMTPAVGVPKITFSRQRLCGQEKVTFEHRSRWFS